MANLYNKAGLVNIPIGYSDGFLYNIKPVDDTLAFRFNRDSSATRVNKQGLIEQVSYFGPELVTNGDFATDSDWSLRLAVIEDGVAKFQESVGTYTRVRQNTGFTGQAKVTYTISFNNTSNTTIQLRGFGGHVFQNSPATVGTHTVYINYISEAVTFQSGDLAAGEEIHLDNVSVVEVLGDKPRIDYTDSLTSPSLLLEPQRTNLITYSEDFTQWGTVNGAVVTDNFTTSPDGTQNAAKVVYDGTSLGRIEINTGASGTNTQSIYLKTVSGTQVVSIGASSSDLTEVTVTSEWKRFTHTGSGSYPRVLCNDAATIYAWGAQLEAGSYATSYIPTSGSTATRVAETCNGAGNASTFNDSEGVLYAEVKRFDNDTAFEAISIGDGTGNNQVVFKFRNTTNIVWVVIKSGGVNQAVMQYTASDLTVFNKLAIKYKANDFALWFNGVQVLTNTSGIVATGLNTLALQDDNGSEQFRGNVKSVCVFNEALTDDELQQLTGPEYNSFAALAAAYNYTVI